MEGGIAAAAPRELPQAAQGQLRSRRFCWLIGLLAMLVSSLLQTAALGGEREPLSAQAARQRLAEANLTNYGNLWLLPAEERLTRQVDKLDRLAREVRNAEDRVGALIEQNAARLRELEQAKTLRKQLLAAAAEELRASERRERLDRQADGLQERIEELETLHLPDEAFAGHHLVRHEVIRWINARNQLGMLTLSLPEAHANLQAEYATLARQPAITAALSAAGDGQRLGPARNYQRLLDRLPEYRPLAFSEVVPLYRSDGRVRVPVVVNERAVATCTWEEASGPTLLPESLLVRAGIEIPADAGWQQTKVGGQRIRGRAVTVPYLRLGDRLATDVEVLALPPEHEDVGCLLRTGAISIFQGEPNPGQLRLKFP